MENCIDSRRNKDKRASSRGVGGHYYRRRLVLHFQDVGAHGRLLHLQPMKWVDDWPVIGIDKDEDGCGEPVLFYKKPDVGKSTLFVLLRKVMSLIVRIVSTMAVEC